jgi:hypothetical protein
MAYPKKILIEACQLAFNGKNNADLEKILGVSKGTIVRWRTLPLWKEIEKDLLEAEKRHVVEKQLIIRAEESKLTAQG